MSEKRIHEIKVRLGETLMCDLASMADRDNRSISDFIFTLLNRHVYGNLSPHPCIDQGHNEADQARHLRERLSDANR